MKAIAITSNKLQAYIAKRLHERAANATVNRELDCLHRMMVLGQRQTPPKILHIPHFPKLTEDNVREGFFENDEFLMLRAAAPDRLKVPVTIAYYTGMRLKEIIGVNGLKWSEHVDFRENCLRLSSRQTKTRQPRVVYMAGDFLDVMLKAKEQRDLPYPSCPYVCHRDGKSYNCLIDAWNETCTRAGIRGRTFHDLRRTGVRNLITAEVPETVAMRISGHRTRSVFDRYNITSEDDLRQAAQRLAGYLQAKTVTVPVTAGMVVNKLKTVNPREPIEIWRRGRDLNSRSPFEDSGFQDRHVRPLRHPSVP
jgi:integrase